MKQIGIYRVVRVDQTECRNNIVDICSPFTTSHARAQAQLAIEETKAPSTDDYFATIDSETVNVED